MAKNVQAEKANTKMNTAAEVKGETKANGASSGNAVLHTERRIKLSDIQIDWDWNARSLASVIAQSTGDDGDGIDAIVASLETRGQDTPVDVRANPDKKSKKPYALVTGFRRCKALELIAAKAGRLEGDPNWNPLEPSVKAFDHGEMAESAAREKNLAENTARANLKGADMVFGLSQAYGIDGKTPNAVIGAKHSRSEGYVALCMRVAKIQPTILTEWRAAKVQLGMAQMDLISKLPPEKQEEAYKSATATKTQDTSEAAGKKRAVAASKKRAGQIGALIGRWAGFGHDIHDPSFVETIGDMLKLPKGEKLNSKGKPSKGLEAIADAAHTEYLKAKDAAEKERIAEAGEAGDDEV